MAPGPSVPFFPLMFPAYSSDHGIGKPLFIRSSRVPKPMSALVLAVHSRKSRTLQLQPPHRSKGESGTTPVRRETPLPHPLKPLPALRSTTGSENVRGESHGSLWTHLGKRDIHREVCGFSFFKRRFKLHLKSLLSFTTMWMIVIEPQWRIRAAGQSPHGLCLGHGPSSRAY